MEAAEIEFRVKEGKDARDVLNALESAESATGLKAVIKTISVDENNIAKVIYASTEDPLRIANALSKSGFEIVSAHNLSNRWLEKVTKNQKRGLIRGY